jgi:hypothetical protein
MKNLKSIVKFLIIVLVTSNLFLCCEKDEEELPKHERRVLEVSILEDFSHYDIQLTVDSQMIRARFHEIIEEGYLPFVIELYDYETITEAAIATINGNTIEVDLGTLTMQFDGPPVVDNLITVFRIDDVEYFIEVIFEQNPDVII